MSHPDAFIRSIRLNLIAAVAVMALLAGAAAIASTLEIAGAVIATGKLVVRSEVKKVQHSTGGTIGEILVANGQAVRAGDVVARLDAPSVRANYLIIMTAIDQLVAKRARLTAERDGATTIDYPQDLITRRGDPEVGRVVNAEEHAFLLRRQAREGEKAQLRERINQLREEVTGLEDQLKSKLDELKLVRLDLEGVRQMWAQQLIQYSRLNTAERQEASLNGELGSIRASIAQTGAHIAETELQIYQVDQQMRGDVARELTDVNASLSELAERRIAAQDLLARVDIRAPQDGIVHQLEIHTVGGVIVPQETLMLIVPQSDDLVADVHVPPNDIDQVHIGQPVFLKFPSFSQRQTPDREGTIVTISADLIEDPHTRDQYYEARIEFNNKDDGFRLISGMPAQAFLRTGDRTIFSYLTKPLTDYFNIAFRTGA